MSAVTGSGAPRSYVAEVQVRWSDCDPAGVVYYPNYFTLVESALLAFLEHRGTTWVALMRELGLGFPRVEAHARYLGPASASDRLRVEIRVAEIRSSGLRLAFAMSHPDGRGVADGEIAFVAVPHGPRAKAGAVALPPALVEVFRPISPREPE